MCSNLWDGLQSEHLQQQMLHIELVIGFCDESVFVKAKGTFGKSMKSVGFQVKLAVYFIVLKSG